MKSTLPILICIAMIMNFIVAPIYEGELPSKTLVIICTISCYICIWWAAFVDTLDHDRIEKLERKIKELEEESED